MDSPAGEVFLMLHPEDDPAIRFLASEGYVAPRRLRGGRWAAIVVFWPGDRGRIISGPIDGKDYAFPIEDGW